MTFLMPTQFNYGFEASIKCDRGSFCVGVKSCEKNIMKARG